MIMKPFLHMRTIWFLLLATVMAMPANAADSPESADVDICVYGSTPAGIMAAYTAQLKGKKVLLISPTKRIGGMTAGGLGWTDIGDSTSHQRIIRGYAREFYRRIGYHYGVASPQFYFEPKVALATFQGFLDEAGLKADKDIWYQWRIVSAQKEGNDVQSIVVEDATNPKVTPQRTVRARVFIDCSYEGDLMARAGISYTVGREGADKYGEPDNGAQCLTKHQFVDGVDPYVVEGDPSSGLLWGIMSDPMPEKGQGDNHIQAYNYRITLSKENFRPISAKVPDNYDPSKYELLFRWMNKKGWSSYGDFIKWTFMKGGSGPNTWNALKTDNNNNGAFSTDMIGYSWDYPEATYEERDSIVKLHEDYTKGLLYILWTDNRVPASIHNELVKWGYPLDEYEDNDHFTPQLYIREARRMLGRLVMTEDYCLKTKVADDPIAWGAYTMDSHNCGRYVVNGMVKNEGDVQRHLTAGPYNISYRSVTPEEKEAKNVLVPVCLSASHIAYGSIRMEPVYMVMGQTTALAAIQAIDEHNCVVQDVDPARCVAEVMPELSQKQQPERNQTANALQTVDITSRVLQNPSFELPLTSTTLPPTGWSEKPAGMTLQRSIDTISEGREGNQAYVCKPATNSTITTPLKLYQQIPAEKLGAGVYHITCKMWIEKDMYGTCCLFADNGEGTKCNTQYWTEQAYYQNDRTGYDGLTYTDQHMSFARYAGGLRNDASLRLERMEVYVNLEDGEDLVLGIRTNSSNQGTDKNGAGYFYVDDFRVERVCQQGLSADQLSDSLLLNYEFEKDPNGKTLDWSTKANLNESAAGGILGWNSNAWTDAFGETSNGTNLQWKWAGWVGSDTAVIPNDFRLYQTIPAEKLQPGIYQVDARMWQSASKLGVTRLYGQSGNNCSVQYYGKQSQYPASVLTEGEDASFAGLSVNTTNGRLSQMSLTVQVDPGQDLEVGVKSGYGAEANNQTGQNFGKFFVDCVRVSLLSGLPLTLSQQASDNAIQASEQVPYQITLLLSLPNNEWSPICLPFSLAATDIRDIFGAGTKVMQMTGVNSEDGAPVYEEVDEMQAGMPYHICPADILPSPIKLDGVRLTAAEPKTVSFGKYHLTGTFQASDEAPAFSALLTEDGTGVQSVPTALQAQHFYDLMGRPVSHKQQGHVYVQQGSKVMIK